MRHSCSSHSAPLNGHASLESLADKYGLNLKGPDLKEIKKTMRHCGLKAAV